MKVIKKAKLEKVLEVLSKDYDVYVPMQRGAQTGFFSFRTYNEDYDDIMLDILNVYQPPKSVVFPQTEKMYNFKEAGQKISIDRVPQASELKIIFGLRSCDLKAIDCLDTLFFTKEYEDEFYRSRRDNTVMIVNACYNPGTNCFCSSMGVSPDNPETADVLIHDVGDGDFAWEAKSAKGEAVTELIKELLAEQEVTLPTLKAFKRKVDYEGVAEKLKDMFDHPMWEDLSYPCHNCGICTYMCPTCYCFDIQVKTTGEEGYRLRCWDSCMYREYSQMAGGHNPRELDKERFRNRFLHKLQFFPERYGEPLCTGCGRCIVVCPAGVNIVKIIEKVKEADISNG
ncbi:MAG TPA: 4Fe-4S dicluster domain-containing protein [Syntrophomonadaceae bacterium]|nr:4Fe-4S dicluster domain-containing protein [Syntrophomonadaceae bacterium]HPR93184.1 4Fe-4S dicluster domain-containing protein [Syntrophomonadaceae bacterium]